MMRARKELKIAGLVVLIACAGLFGFDQYMKATWDHHIVVKPSWYSVNGNSSKSIWSTMTQEEAIDFQNQHKIEIVKQNEVYVWIQNNESHELISSLGTLEENKHTKEYQYLFLQTIDKKHKFRIFLNEYHLFGCRRIFMQGNFWYLNNSIEQEEKKYYGEINVYEGLTQYLFCNNYSKRKWGIN